MKKIPEIAIAGMGGFATEHITAILAMEERGVCRLIAACEPVASVREDVDKRFELSKRGVSIFEDFESMIAFAQTKEVAMIEVATPIQFHRAMHRQCIEAGLPCYLEKPPTLHWQTFLEMVESEKMAKVATCVGFNFATEPGRQALMKRVAAGEFGKLRRIGFCGLWPRSRSYYTRNQWAGRRWVNGEAVMDCCTGNAFAHFVQNTFEWVRAASGPARIGSLYASLARANAIETFDTLFAHIVMKGGIEIRIGATHACPPPGDAWELLVFDEAEIECVAMSHAVVRWRNGHCERIEFPKENGLQRNLGLYLQFIAGEQPVPPVTLDQCGNFVILHSTLLTQGEPMPVDSVPFAIDVQGQHHDLIQTIPGIRAQVEEFAKGGNWRDTRIPNFHSFPLR